MRAWDALDQSAQAEAAEVVGHASARKGVEFEAPQCGQPRPQVGVAETPREQGKEDQRVEEREHPRIGEPQRRRPLALDHDRPGHGPGNLTAKHAK